ncbi:MAG: hypothetical protein R2882_11605 [Gemmatimonadales bacterium]
MTRDARLLDAGPGHQVVDLLLAGAEGLEDPPAGRVGQGLKRVELQ